MNIKELYELMKSKLKNMYAHNQDTVVLDQMQFFALYKLVCDMAQIKHITDGQ